MCVPGCFLIDHPDNQWNKPAFTETRPSFWKYSSQKSSYGIPRCGFSNSPVFQVEEILGFILGRGGELLGANDLFTACVCNLFLAGWRHDMPPNWSHSFYLMRFHRCDESNKWWGCHTPSDIWQSPQPCRKRVTFLRLLFTPLAWWRWAVTFSYEHQNKILSAQNFWSTLKMKA